MAAWLYTSHEILVLHGHTQAVSCSQLYGHTQAANSLLGILKIFCLKLISSTCLAHAIFATMQ